MELISVSSVPFLYKCWVFFSLLFLFWSPYFFADALNNANKHSHNEISLIRTRFCGICTAQPNIYLGMHATYYTYIYLYLNGYVDDASTVIATDKQRDRSIVCLLDQIIAILAKQSQRLRTIDSADEKKKCPQNAWDSIHFQSTCDKHLVW